MKDVTLEMINDLIKKMESVLHVGITFRYYGDFSASFRQAGVDGKIFHSCDTKEELTAIFAQYE